MQFLSVQFLVFFILVLLLAAYTKNFSKSYKYFILFVSLVFYAFFGFKFFSLLIVNILVNYIFILYVYSPKVNKKLILTIGLIVNVVFLVYFKYYNFFIDTYLQIVKTDVGINLMQMVIPVGVSFYTFRVISHLVDAYRGKIEKPQLIEYACYVSFFPQITSGPIARAGDFYYNLRNPRAYTYSAGEIIVPFLSGFLKKYVIASFLFEVVTGPFATPENFSSLDLIISAFSYSMLIYVDFSGYSDIAIAISNLLGFQVNKNFNYPYKSIGISEFWSRWHISLSSWFRDYVYIPLGGNRKGKVRKYLNVFITMFLSGLWHGAGYNFMIWGTMHAGGTAFSEVVEDLFKKIHMEKLPVFAIKILKFVGWLTTFVYLTITWIFFNSKNLDRANVYINTILNGNDKPLTLLTFRVVFVFALVLLMTFYGEKVAVYLQKFLNKSSMILKVLITIVFVYILINIGPETVPPFIYFNF